MSLRASRNLPFCIGRVEVLGPVRDLRTRHLGIYSYRDAYIFFFDINIMNRTTQAHDLIHSHNRSNNVRILTKILKCTLFFSICFILVITVSIC